MFALLKQLSLENKYFYTTYVVRAVTKVIALFFVMLKSSYTFAETHFYEISCFSIIERLVYGAESGRLLGYSYETNGTCR